MTEEKYTYNRKERLEMRELRYKKILEWIKADPLCRREIEDKLEFKGLKIYENALIKDYLNQMVEKREIGSLSKSFEHKDYKWIFKQAYGKRWDMKKNTYYFYTPRSKLFYEDLTKLVSDVSNKKRVGELIDEISNIFRVLEIMSVFEMKRFFNDTIVKRVLKNMKKKVSIESIQEEKDHTLKTIVDFSSKNFKIGVSSLTNVKEIKGVSYLVLNNNLIPLEQITPYLTFPRSKMSNIMAWVSHHREVNESTEAIDLLLTKKMLELFLEVKR
jgi:hypothetical protein